MIPLGEQQGAVPQQHRVREISSPHGRTALGVTSESPTVATLAGLMQKSSRGPRLRKLPSEQKPGH